MSKGKILLVEPDEDIRTWIKAALVAEGYRVWAVESPEQGLKLVHEKEFHALLLDNQYSYPQVDPENKDFLLAGIPIIFTCHKNYRFDSLGELIPNLPSILKKPLSEEDRLKLRKMTEVYRKQASKGDVWIVEADTEYREFLLRVLNNNGYKTQAFRFATQALVSMYQANEPEIILLLDANVPEQVLLECQKREIIVFLLVPKDKQFRDFLEETARFKIYEYLVKPFDYEEILVHLPNALDYSRRIYRYF